MGLKREKIEENGRKEGGGRKREKVTGFSVGTFKTRLEVSIYDFINLVVINY